MSLTDLSTLKRLGNGVKIFPFVKIAKGDVVEIDDGTQIDDFTFINGGMGVRIGKLNHIASFVSVVGGGELITGDYVGIITARAGESLPLSRKKSSA
jgi:acyl-[acyl carrier protein]--UDP-N-acetylglucosamine O-acyltransferase